MDRKQGSQRRSRERNDDRMHPRLRGHENNGPGMLGYAGAALAAFAGGFLIGRMLPGGDALRRRLGDRHSEESGDIFAPRYTDPAAPGHAGGTPRTDDQRPSGYVATDRNAPGRKVPDYQSTAQPENSGLYNRDKLVDKMSEDSFPTSDPPGTY